jgi:hypothetical protein
MEQADSVAEHFIIEPTHSPYAHNPVSWHYAVFVYENEEIVSNFEVDLVTTPLRQLVDGLGLTFTLIARIGEELGVLQDPSVGNTPVFEKRHGLITSGGLWLSGPLAPDTTLVTSIEGAVSRFGEEPPTWPLPEQPGCHWEHVNVSLKFGVTRAIMTQCHMEGGEEGTREITTLWVEGIGFVYREMVVASGGNHRVQHDYLVDGGSVWLRNHAIALQRNEPKMMVV